MGCLMPQSAGPARLFADSASPERELRFHSGCRMRKRPRRTGSRTFLHLLECRGKVESSAFRIVSDLVILSLLAAIPSTGIVLHRAHPSRLPFGAQPRRGPDGTPVAMRGNTLRDEGMAACAWRPCRKRNFLLCRNRNFLLCSDTLQSVPPLHTCSLLHSLAEAGQRARCLGSRGVLR